MVGFGPGADEMKEACMAKSTWGKFGNANGNGDGPKKKIPQTKTDRMICHHCGNYADMIGYAPEEFSIPASDEQGHSEKLWTKVPPQYTNEISAVVHSDLFPWRSSSDFLRFAVHHTLRFVFSLNPAHPNHLALLESMNRIIQRSEFLTRFSKTVDFAEQQVNTLVSRGPEAKQEAIRLVFELLGQSKKMPHGYWRESFEAELQKKFGYLLEGQKSTSFLTDSDETSLPILDGVETDGDGEGDADNVDLTH
jgi:hypothetical protein